MKKPSLLQITFIITILGIFLLLIINNSIEPNLIKIKNINEKHLNTQIKIKGIITNLHYFKKSNFQTILLDDKTGEIQIILNKKLNLELEQELIVLGKITDYQNNFQIQPDKIILLKPPRN